MTELNRRTVLKTLAATSASIAILSPRSVFAAAEFQYKMATDAPAGHPVNTRLAEATDAIREKTSGRVDIQLFPSNQLGSSTDMLSQVRSGAIEFQSIPASVLTILVPATSICGLGFAFKDYDTVWSAMDGELGAYIRGQIATRNLVAMDKILDNGFREITSSQKPIESAADLNGFKIRVPVSPMSSSLFKSLNAAPASINFAELYSSLQTRIVDGQENALPIIQAGKLYEVQKYCSVTNHMWDGYWIVANKRAFAALPDDLQLAISEELDKAAMLQRQDIRILSDTLRPYLEQSGMTFNEPDGASFREVLAQSGFYSDWQKTFGDEAWHILESYTGKLG